MRSPVRKSGSSGILAAAFALGALVLLALPQSALAAAGVRPAPDAQLALFDDDPCDDQHDALKDSDDFFDKQIVQAVVAGGVAGAIGGALSGGWKGALIGGGVAAATSGLLAYYNERQQQAAGNQEALAQSIGGDARTYGVAMDKATAAFLALKQCRINQAASIKAAYASGKISREEAQERLAKVRKRFEEELEIADHLGAQMNRRQEEMQAASDQLLASDPEARTVVTDMNGGPPPPGAYGGPPPNGAPPNGGPPPGAPPPNAPPPSAELTVEVARNGVVHEGPASYTKRIVTLERGDTVIVAGPNQGDWVPVRLVDGRTGYINSHVFKPGAVEHAHAAPPPPPREPPRETRREKAREELAAAPPASRATVQTVETTRSNRKRRESYSSEVKTAHNDAQVAFNMN